MSSLRTCWSLPGRLPNEYHHLAAAIIDQGPHSHPPVCSCRTAVDHVDAQTRIEQTVRRRERQHLEAPLSNPRLRLLRGGTADALPGVRIGHAVDADVLALMAQYRLDDPVAGSNCRDLRGRARLRQQAAPGRQRRREAVPD